MSPAPEEVPNAEHPQHLQGKVPPFFTLPREVRDMIYHLVVGEEGEYCQSRECHVSEQDMGYHTFIQREDLWPTCNRFNIAQTCRIANEEANEIIYRKNKFCFYGMSTTWLRPQISQKSADVMQKIHIVLSSDVTSRQGLVHFLRMFTFSQIVRKECWIELILDADKDLTLMHPIFKVLLSFTTFEVVLFDLAGEFRRCPCPKHVQARSEWKQVKKELESALGTAVSSCGASLFYLKFKPREHLAQKGLSS